MKLEQGRGADWLRVTTDGWTQLLPVAGPVCGVSSCIEDGDRTGSTVFTYRDGEVDREIRVEESIDELFAQLNGITILSPED